MIAGSQNPPPPAASAFSGGFGAVAFACRGIDAHAGLFREPAAGQAAGGGAVRGQQRAADAKRVSESARAAAEKQALAQTRQQVLAQLNGQFKAIVGDQLKQNAADDIWQDVIEQLSATTGRVQSGTGRRRGLRC